MTDDPPAALLLAEVRKEREEGLGSGFAAKVAANALGIAQRELECPPPASAADVASLCAAIQAGAVDEGLIGELIRITLAKLQIDQPSYPPYRLWREGGQA